jgi:GWxTD domain-containing protein
MNLIRPAIFIMSLMIILNRNMQAQTPELTYENREEAPDFFYDTMTVASEDSELTTFRFYSKIAYDELQFIKKDGRFQAQYELSVTVFDLQGNQADGRIERRDIWVDTFNETNTRDRFDVVTVEFNLKPAVYELLASIMDFDSRKTGRRKTRVTIPQYLVQPLEISDVLLTDRVLPDSAGRLKAVPNVLGNFGNQQESLFLWFEVYDLIGLDSLRLNYRILNSNGDEIRSYHEIHRLDGVRTQVVMHIPRDELHAGRYRLELWAGKGKSAVTKVRDLSVHWMGMPAYADNLDKAIDQIKYIAGGKELKAIRKAKGEEKSRLFKKFWKSKDPTPSTEENEVMEEYYRRVDYANASFGTFIEGWRTDRGMVYIILGAPNDIERHPFEVDSKPYEIWSYYQYNRQFIFVDQTGFGEYRLISPFWEILNEIR